MRVVLRDRALYCADIVAVVDRPEDIEDEEAMRFFGGEEGDAELSQG